MKTNKIVLLGAIVFILLGTLSCKKEKDTQVNTFDVKMCLAYQVDNSPLEYNTVKYTNAAGNNYSVSKLQFYLSSFVFENNEGKTFTFDSVYYVDATAPAQLYLFKGLPEGSYKSIKFNIGLDAAKNKSNTLENTVNNQNMAWPEMMGGGYHFLKLEGNYKSGNEFFGFNMHLGKNNNLVPISLNQEFKVAVNAPILQLNMNINKWFEGAYTYDLNTDASYTMTDSLAMNKLAQNGKNVFSIK